MYIFKTKKCINAFWIIIIIKIACIKNSHYVLCSVVRFSRHPYDLNEKHKISVFSPEILPKLAESNLKLLYYFFFFHIFVLLYIF